MIPAVQFIILIFFFLHSNTWDTVWKGKKVSFTVVFIQHTWNDLVTNMLGEAGRLQRGLQALTQRRCFQCKAGTFWLHIVKRAPLKRKVRTLLCNWCSWRLTGWRSFWGRVRSGPGPWCCVSHRADCWLGSRHPAAHCSRPEQPAGCRKASSLTWDSKYITILIKINMNIVVCHCYSNGCSY